MKQKKWIPASYETILKAEQILLNEKDDISVRNLEKRYDEYFIDARLHCFFLLKAIENKTELQKSFFNNLSKDIDETIDKNYFKEVEDSIGKIEDNEENKIVIENYFELIQLTEKI